MADEGNAGATPAVETLQAQLAAASAELANAKARITELNNEAKGHRLNGDNHRKAAEDAAKARDDAIAEAARIKAEIETATAEKVKAAETRATEALTKAQQRAVNADLKVAAKEAGANDNVIGDVLALLPRDKLKISDDGEVTNAADVMSEFRKAKPHLFGSPGTTSNTQAPPPPRVGDGRAAMGMSTDEWRAARRRIARGERI